MQTNIHESFANTAEGREAEQILRACVHCGFCTATCPTYLELRDERDSPRGRIYLIKQLLEGGDVTAKTRTHLDRCLTCRSCETTCPSGVRYGRLVDIGRGVVEQQLERSIGDKFVRWALRQVLPHKNRFGTLLRLGQLVRPLLPQALKAKVPPRRIGGPIPAMAHKRVMIVLDGCAQPSATPNTNGAAARVLDKLGVSLLVVPEAGCCGAVSYHLAAHDEGLDFMRANIDAWWPAIDAGAEAIVISASGCGTMVKEYGELLHHDPAYAQRAQRVSELARDIGEILADEDLASLAINTNIGKVAIHTPCTLQHGQKLPDLLPDLLTRVGFDLAPTTERHLCCGSAGTYSILEPAMSKQLRDNKVKALTIAAPSVIVTANIGCQLHMESGTDVVVRHWVELLDPGN